MDLPNSHSGSETFSNYSEPSLENTQQSHVVFPRYSSEEIIIPLTSLSSNHEDPRFFDQFWRDNIYNLKKNELNSYNIPSLEVKKLNVVIDLEAMIYMIHPKVPHNPDSIEKEIKRLKDRYHQYFKSIKFSAVGVYFIIAIRPNLDSFLRNLNKKSTLHLITSKKDNYLHEILKAIDPHYNFFQGRVFHSQGKERSLSKLELDTSDTVIIDSDVGNWISEDQENIIPSMKYIPCPQEHSDYADSSRYQELVKSYTYIKGLPIFDEKIPFIDKEDQLPNILRLISKIHKHRFLSFYTKGVSEILTKLKKDVLKGKSVFFLCADEDIKDIKIEVYRAITEMLGGTIINSSCDADYIITDDNISGDSSKFKRSEWLISKFFS